ncbi:heat-inducible transcriptional repressor HrcA [Candidatus Mycoplasma haematominutum]|uniref:Heat-inducible transcription repressor HrcA n=1 Tax=Candidatus Mycoplasma haematominutum 'Birmingham 1' TaxID=1116213 RepID=G8C2H2_9MOLU|nr:heat-inducible transcriptional repressor HrcA [Candidatus Mycoplasma haematominutum]CCE66520.1 heat-inducible transcription repressor HrcA [Candidatus Mycoplasma haematominutum 'Birmingham 1']
MVIPSKSNISLEILSQKKNYVLNERQKEILKMIIELYISEKGAISSLSVKSKKFYRWSSATIRNEMLFLENKGLLKKEHHSSGRIPTKEGYRIYIDDLMGNLKSVNSEIKSKLVRLFSDRNESIDVTLDKSAEIISNFLNLPIVVSGVNNLNNEILKKLDLVEISDDEFIILAVSSSGEVYKDKIVIEEFKEREDLSICVKLLNENLLGCPLSDIYEAIIKMLPKIRSSVHKYEFVYEKIITKICSGVVNKQNSLYRIYNKNSIISQPEVKNNQISLEKIFNVLENYSTFSQLNSNYFKTGKTLINLESEVEGISVATTVLNSKEKVRSLSIIGPLRMNYPLIRSLFEFINEKLVDQKNIE